MKVRNFMSTGILLLDPEISLRAAATLFLENKIDGAPVVKNGIIVGLFTKTHLITAVSAGENGDRPVQDFMAKKVVEVRPDDNILDIKMEQIGHYPVVEEDGTLLGIITKSDITVALNEIVNHISGQIEAVINSAYNPIIAINKEGYISIWNYATEKLTNYKTADVLGRFINNVVPESQLLRVIKTGCREFGVKVKVAGIPTITNRSPIISNGEIVGAVAVLHDMSEIEAISRELEYVKALNAELDVIIDSSFDGLFITDANGVTIRTNRAIKRVTGIEEEKFTNKSVYELVEQGILSNSATIMALERKTPATANLSTITGRTLLSSATPVFDENNNLYRVVTNVRDISELNIIKPGLEKMPEPKKRPEIQTARIREGQPGEFLFKNREMGKIVYQAIKIAEVDSTVLLSGESGVGKEMIANIIQRNSNRKNGPYVKLNCAAIPENLIESELFGYETGAFTGAKKEGKPGLFEVANGGTFLLDEVGDIPAHLQVKLLRALQEREIFRVGGTEPIKIDVRIIAITNKDLELMVRKGEFREDLFYRLNVVPIYIPPLRERRDDIPILTNHFMNSFNKRYNLRKEMDAGLVETLVKYDWPGNIRQLENLVERLQVTSSAEIITQKHLPPYFFNDENEIYDEQDKAIVVNRIMPLKHAVAAMEKTLLEKTFSLTGSWAKAAMMLEVDPSTVSRKASKYGINSKPPPA